MKKNQRMISTAGRAKIYHKDGCPHIVRIKENNRDIVLAMDAKKMGYRACKCCNSANFQYRQLQSEIRKYAQKNQMELYQDRKELFIKTDIGIWKTAYLTDREKFILYHGNNGSFKIPIDHAWRASYHRQMDQKATENLMELLKYIKNHDLYRKQVKEAGGNEMAVTVSKKYEKQRSNRMRRQERKRVAGLFAMIERQYPEYRKLSFC